MSDYNTKYVYKGKVDHCCKYCGRHLRFSEYGVFESISKNVSVDENGYAIRLDEICSECSVRVAKKSVAGIQKVFDLSRDCRLNRRRTACV